MSSRGYTHAGGYEDDSSSSSDEESGRDSDDEATVDAAMPTDLVDESAPVPMTGDEFEDTMTMMTGPASVPVEHKTNKDDGDEDAGYYAPSAAAVPTTGSEAARYMAAQKLWSTKKAAATAAAPTDAASLDRNIFKEGARQVQRGLGSFSNPRAMKLYPTLSAPAGSFTAVLLKVLATEVDGNDTIQTGLERDRFPQLFLDNRFRTDVQDCSIYATENPPARVRQLVDNERIDTNVYFPRAGEGLLGSGEHLVVFEYDFRALAAASTAEEVSKHYGLSKSSFLHAPGEKEASTHVESQAILLSFSRLPDILVKPQISGDIAESRGTRRQVEDRIWYSVGSGGREAAFTRNEPLVIFRFSNSTSEGLDQRLAFVYLVMSQSDGTLGFASLIDTIYPKGGAAPAAASTALHAISQMAVGSAEERLQIARASHHLARLFTTKVTPDDGAREVGHLHVIPVETRTAAAADVSVFKRRFMAFFAALGRAETDAEANSVFFGGQGTNEQYRFDAFHKSNFNATSTVMSQMIYAVQHRLTPCDSVSRLAELWQDGAAALEHFAPSPILLDKVAAAKKAAIIAQKPVAAAKPATMAATAKSATTTTTARSAPIPVKRSMLAGFI